MRDVMPMNVDDHLDEVLGIVEKPKKEVVKAERLVPVISDDDSDLDDDTEDHMETSDAEYKDTYQQQDDSGDRGDSGDHMDTDKQQSDSEEEQTEFEEEDDSELSKKSTMSDEGQTDSDQRSTTDPKQSANNSNKKHIRCWKCKEVGHYKSQCPLWQTKKQEEPKNEEEKTTSDETKPKIHFIATPSLRGTDRSHWKQEEDDIPFQNTQFIVTIPKEETKYKRRIHYVSRHIQCWKCKQYGHYRTQCTEGIPKKR